jgi:hypothetical protein
LLPGDRFLQIHRFLLPVGASSGPYTLEVGLYDPLTDQRWRLRDTVDRSDADRLLFPVAGSGS